MAVQQGELYWVQYVEPDAGPTIPHPYVVIQDDALDATSATTVACALTSNLRRASMPGSVLLASGEAGLLRPSVVEVSKRVVIRESDLGEYIGKLTPERVAQILAGIAFVERTYLRRPR